MNSVAAGKPSQPGKADRGLSRQAAQEAQFWFSFMRRHRHGADSIRELISIPPQIEALLWNFVKQHPAERRFVEKTIRFRECVGEEFERLLTPSS
jgi:hypothetical protein